MIQFASPPPGGVSRGGSNRGLPTEGRVSGYVPDHPGGTCVAGYAFLTFENGRAVAPILGGQAAPLSFSRYRVSFVTSTYSSRRPANVKRYPRSASRFHATIRPAL